jgi:hypothetical protein
VQDHHVHRDADGRGQAMDHHAWAVAHKDDLGMGIDQCRQRRGIGDQRNNGRSTLAGGDLGGGDAPDRGLGGHDSAFWIGDTLVD